MLGVLTFYRNYLEDESENKKGTRYDLSSWKLEICKGIPLQENGSDCGVFMCMVSDCSCDCHVTICSISHDTDFMSCDLHTVCTSPCQRTTIQF